MSARSHAVLGTVTIASGQQNSPAFALPNVGMPALLLVCAPSTLTGTVTIQVSFDGGSSFYSTAVTVPVNQVAKTDVVAPHVRLSSSAAEGANRTFTLVGIYEV